MPSSCRETLFRGVLPLFTAQLLIQLLTWEAATKSVWKDASQKHDEKMFSCLYNESQLTFSAVSSHTLENTLLDIKWQDFLGILSTKISSVSGKLRTLHMLLNCSSKWRENQDALPSVIQRISWKGPNLDILEIMRSQHPGLHSPTNFLQYGDFWARRAVSGWSGLNTGSVPYGDINAILLLSMARASKVPMNVSHSQGRMVEATN